MCEAAAIGTLGLIVRGCGRLSRSDHLQRLFSAFPAGRPGVGVLLVRLVAGATAVLQGAFVVFDRDVVSIAALLGMSIAASGLALIVGILTPAAAAVLAAALAALLLLFASEPVPPFGSAALVLVVANALALVLVGPGAYSVDARLFGRREIRIPGDTPQVDE